MTRNRRRRGPLAWLLSEVRILALIALNMTLLFLTWLLLVGLVPGDFVGFNVTGSLVVIAVLSAPSFFLNRYVNRLLGHRA